MAVSLNVYYITENLKIKHLFVRKLPIYAAIITVLFSYLLSNSDIGFYVTLFSWTYTFVLPIVLSFTCALLGRIDKQMGERAVKGLALNYKKVWIGKMLLAVKSLFLFCGILFFGYYIISIVFGDKELNFSVIRAILLIPFSFFWQIPLYLFVYYKTNIVITILSGFIMNIIGCVVFAMKSYWMIFPFSYSSRMMCPILKIMPNGFILNPNNPAYSTDLESNDVITIGIIILIPLTIMLSWLSAKWYQNKEVL